MMCCATYLDYIDQNDRIIVFEIHSVFRADNIGNSLDDNVSVEFFIPPHCRSDGILSILSQACPQYGVE